jgi:hypothetical protein
MFLKELASNRPFVISIVVYTARSFSLLCIKLIEPDAFFFGIQMGEGLEGLKRQIREGEVNESR